MRVCRGAARCCSSFVLAGCDDQAGGISWGLLPAQGRLQMLQHQLSLELTKQTTALRSAQAMLLSPGLRLQESHGLRSCVCAGHIPAGCVVRF